MSKAPNKTRPALTKLIAVPPSDTNDLFVPTALPPGKYKLTVTAEDFAHNIGTSEAPLEVTP